MRKYQNLSRILSVLLVLAMVLSCIGMTAFTAATPCAESGCSGEYHSGFCSKNGAHYEAAPEQDGVYQISNAGQLYWFAALVNSGDNEYEAGDNGDVYNAVLTADIVINAELGEDSLAWTPIGLYTSATEYVRYSGTFDGAGYTISGLYYSNTAYTGRTVGLFGCLDANGTVKNLTLANSAIRGATDVGGIVAHNYGKVLGCTLSGTVTGTGTTGGIVARNMDGGSVKDSKNTAKVTGATTGGIIGENMDTATVANCTNTGNVSGTNSVGGVVGINKGTVSGSFNIAKVTATGTHAGGIVGNHIGGEILACGNTGAVTGGSDYVGGVAGACSGANITKSYNSGSVAGGQSAEAVGGVVGAIDGTNLAKSTVTSCYNIGNVTGRGWVGGIAGVSGYQKSTPQTVEFKNSYNAGTVQGSTNVGAVVGDLNKGTVTGSFYLQGCAQNSVSGATAATAQQFASGEITDKLNEAFNVWHQELDVDAYPVLEATDSEPDETVPEETTPEETTPEETTPVQDGTVNVALVLGEKETATYTDNTGNYEDADVSALDTDVATVEITGAEPIYHKSLSEKVTAIESGKQYVLFNISANNLMNNAWADASVGAGGTSGLSLSSAVNNFQDKDCWTITTTEGGYYIQDQNGKYATVARGSAGVSDTPVVIDLNHDGSDWTIGQSGEYMNNFGGANTAVAGWNDINDVNSQWYIYEVVTTAEESCEITFTAVGEGETSVQIGDVTYNITVDAAEPEDTTPSETDPVETKPQETTPVETKPAETTPEETKPAETTPEETKPAETTPEETKPEDEKPTVPECEKDENCVLAQFNDVIIGDWYHDGIHFCVEEGIMNGMGEGKFAPNEATTRAQLVTMLYRLAGEPSVEGLEDPFTDVTADDWFYAPIVWAYENKVVNGVSDTEFAPNANVTREQVATILHRYLGAPEGTGKLEEFPDVAKVSEYAVAPLTWAVGEGLITGVAQPDGTTVLDPAGNATRAQIATILMRHLTK